MNADAFREALLVVMEGKDHWAWPLFTSGQVRLDRLHIHFEQEYATYVRDFPMLIGRAHAQCEVPEVRRELAENLYEEETGGLVAGRPHPELFLEYPKGLGMDLGRFEEVELLAAAEEYRRFLDDATIASGWSVAAAVTTLFIEGTRFERGEIEPGATKRPEPPLAEHPLVKHYGLPIERLELTKAHRAVEGEHRVSAWRIMCDHIPPGDHPAVLEAMEQALEHWLSYRDDVATLCGLVRPA